ncbi:hypothetical protein pb186bvf_006871 [Paramecium bursaria]
MQKLLLRQFYKEQRTQSESEKLKNSTQNLPFISNQLIFLILMEQNDCSDYIETYETIRQQYLVSLDQ